MTLSTLIRARVIVNSSVSPPSCRTVMVTSVPSSPVSFLIASIMGISKVSSPLIVITMSPACTPASQAGESSSGLTICSRLSTGSI